MLTNTKNIPAESSAVLIRNTSPDYCRALESVDAEAFGVEAAGQVARFLAHRDGHAPTPLVALPALAHELGVGSIHIKDEGQRLGLGSFKALGGAYAVIRLAVESAS